jgi:16S rRNA (guanine527-N7)-methyltransferase
MIKRLVRDLLAKTGTDVSEKVLNRVEEYDRILLKWNQRINLTGLVKEEDRALWLYAESLWAANKFQSIQTLVDIGCGCGFPGLAFQWMNDCTLVLLESKERKTHFLKEVVRSMDMGKTETRNEWFEGNMDFYQRKENEEITVSWRALAMDSKSVRKLGECLVSGDSLLVFLGKEGGEIQKISNTAKMELKKKELFPLASNRFVVQMVKCST